MPLLSADDPIPGWPRRILVAGTSGSGKTTLAARVAEMLRISHVEIDALFHGPNWTPRPTFEDDVRRLVAEPEWVTEWQYSQVRAVAAARAELLVWLDLPRWRVMEQVIRRRLSRQVLWNGNIEPPVWTIVTNSEHIVRWAWTTHAKSAQRVAELRRQRPDLVVVRLTSRSAVDRWVAGPLHDVARPPRPG